MENKRCCTCKETKNIKNFYKNKSMKDGYGPQCKQCKKDEYLKRTEGKFNYRVFDQSELLKNNLKRCSKCESIKSTNDFLYDAKNKNHFLSSWCKDCLYSANEKRRREKGQKSIISRTELDDKLLELELKRCSLCREIKDLKDFVKSKKGYGGYGSHCKECRLELDRTKYKDKKIKNTRKWRKNNPKWKEQHRLHQAKRNGLIKESRSNLSKEFIENIYNTEHCYYCNKFIDPDKRTLEHKNPLSRGGLHVESNIVMACLSCNCSKRDKTEEEYLEWKKQRSWLIQSM